MRYANIVVMSRGWDSAREAARTIAPAARWRSHLAREVRRASDARFVAVFTCPAGNPVEAQASVAPQASSAVVQRIHAEFLTRIERAGSGVTIAKTVGAAAYAPLSKTPRRALAAELRREVLAPEGVDGLLNAFLVPGKGPALGWICVGTKRPSRESLRAHGDELSAVARAAATTLEAALDLAEACGAQAAVVDPALASLSARERQIAALIAADLSDANVAARLSLSEETVGSHLRRIYRKLGVHTRVALAARLARVRKRTFVIAD